MSRVEYLPRMYHVQDDEVKARVKARIDAMSLKDLIRGLFAMTPAPDLERYRQMAPVELVELMLFSDDPGDHSSCKQVLKEHMTARNTDDIMNLYSLERCLKWRGGNLRG